MHSDRVKEALEDIVDNIGLARRFIGELDYPQFETDTKTVYAVVRCLEIISEASRRLPQTLKDRHSDVLWRDIAGAGNIYRHGYQGVEVRVVWNTVKDHLVSLEGAVRTEIESI